MMPSLDKARSHGSTGQHGIVMANGVIYHGNIWNDNGVLFVTFANRPVLVSWHAESGRYVVRSSTWQDKASLLIARLSYAAFAQANKLPDGSFRARHVPYRLPDVCHDLIECLKANDEHRAKALFLNDYTLAHVA